MTPLALAFDDVTFTWSGQGGFSLACPKLHLKPGETALLLGASGSGKSTLLSLAGGITLAQSGSVHVGGQNLALLRAGARDRFRAEQIGVIFQQFNLLPYARVLDNILLPLRFAPNRRARTPHPTDEAARLCTALGLPNDVLNQHAGRLSVGQQQRVAAARALIGAPPLIIADEPTSALDADTQDSFIQLLFDQAAQAGSALIMVSHDARLGAHFDTVLHLDEITTTRRAP